MTIKNYPQVQAVLCMTFSLLTSLSFFQTAAAQIILNRGQAVSVNPTSGSQTQYVLNVPSETKNVSFKLSGGSGNADLYEQRGFPATTTVYYTKSTDPSNEESLLNLSPEPKYYVLVNAVSAVQGASLVANYEASDFGSISSGVPVRGLTLASNSSRHFFINVPTGKNKLIFQTAGGTGDGDLYSKFGSAPTIASYEKRSNGATNTELITIDNSCAGIYYIMLHAYSTVANTTLTATVQQLLQQRDQLPLFTLPGSYDEHIHDTKFSNNVCVLTNTLDKES